MHEHPRGRALAYRKKRSAGMVIPSASERYTRRGAACARTIRRSGMITSVQLAMAAQPPK
jgi:hypothetical protein